MKQFRNDVIQRLLHHECLFPSLRGRISEEDFNWIHNLFQDQKKAIMDLLDVEKLNETYSKQLKLHSDKKQKIQDEISSRKKADQQGNIEIAILYSEPLVRKVKYNTLQPHTVDHFPVDFMGECNSILKSLKDLNKEIRIYLKCLRSDFFKKALMKKPSILHLICHGGFNEDNQFFLEFESNSGELLEYEADEIQRLIEETGVKNNDTKLVFINACYSEQMAEIFIEAGAQCVISI